MDPERTHTPTINMVCTKCGQSFSRKETGDCPVCGEASALKAIVTGPDTLSRALPEKKRNRNTVTQG